MSKNLESTTKLTEFAPLSPEEKRTGVGFIFSRFFKRAPSRDTSPIPNADSYPAQVLPFPDRELEHVAAIPGDDWHCRDDDSDHSSARESTASLHPSTLPFPIYADVGDGRSLPNVLKRISNLLAMKSGGLQAYKDTDFKQYWMPDSVSKECYDCCDKFTTFRRRHHCRVCGQIFCSRCCNQEIPGKIMGCTGDLRVCTYCCKVVLSYLQSPDIGADLSADLRAVQEDLQNKFGEVTAGVTSSHSNTTLGVPAINPMQSPIEVGRERTVGNTRTIGRRKQSYQEDRFALGRGGNLASPSSYLVSEDLELSAEERWQALHGSSTLRALWEEIRHANTGVPLQSHRYRLRSFPACFVGTELVDWLLAHNRAATMVQAVALGQALIDGGYMECISHFEPIFQDSYALYRFRNQPATSRELSSPPSSPTSTLLQTENIWTKQLDQLDSVDNADSESEIVPNMSPVKEQDSTNIPSSSSNFYLEVNVQENRVQLRRPKQEIDDDDDELEIQNDLNDFQQGLQKPISEADNKGNSCDILANYDLSSTGISREFLTDTLLVEGSQNRELVPSMGWHRVQHLRTDNGEREAYTRLTTTFEQHEKQLLQQLLSAEGLPQSWGETVIPLVHQVVDLVRPDVRNEADDMDIRQYVQFKKVTGGSRNECCVVSGVVCTKNVAHRSMSVRLTNPRILLLGCSIIYERVEGRLISLEPLIMQEQNYLKNVVARIVSLQPDIVLVERTVSRLAQDLLLEQGITLILNVKATVLERVARLTLSDIITCIDAHVGKPRIGMCHNFYLRNFQLDLKNQSKTLMFFDGCATHLGCTTILRGGNADELRRLKRVLSHLILVNYSWRHEKSFLMDEFAMPPCAPADTFFADEELISNTGNTVENVHKTNKDEGCIKSTCMKAKENCDKEVIKDTVTGEKVKTRSRTQCRDKGNCCGDDKKIETVVDQSDPLHQYLASDGKSQSTGDDNEVFSSSNSQLSVATLPLTNRFRKALDDTVLSSSPYLQFSIPFLETEAGRQSALRRFFPDQVFWSPQLSATSHTQPEVATFNATKNDNFLENKMDSIFVRPNHPFVYARLTKCVESWEVQALLSSFRAVGGRLRHPEEREDFGETTSGKESRTDSKSLTQADVQPHWPTQTFVDALNPINHQRLAVLFCSFSQESRNAPAFCVNPWVVHMELYGSNDIPLGNFLEQYCFRKSYACPSKTCTTPMLQHIRRFVHDAGCVQVTLKELDCQIPVQGNAILMWSWCHICKSVSPVVPMSVDTWLLSFAKYLELRFHGSMYQRRGKENICSDSLHHDHYQYFGYRDVVASFKYTAVTLWEISLPPRTIVINCNAGTQAAVQAAAIEEVKQLAWKGYEVFSIVLEKLCLFSSEAESSKLDGISSLKNQLKREHANFKCKIEEIQLRLTSPTLEARRLGSEAGLQLDPSHGISAVERDVGERLWDIEDCLVQLKRMIAEAVSIWNTRLAEITKKKDEKSKKSGDTLKLLTSNTNVDNLCDDFCSDLARQSSLSSPLTQSLSDQEAMECNEDTPAHVITKHITEGGLDLGLTSSSETSHNEFWYSSSDKKNSSSLDELCERSHEIVQQIQSSFSSPTVEGLEAGLGVHQAWAEHHQYVLVHNSEVPEETRVEVVKGHERSHSEGESRSASVVAEEVVDGGNRSERRSIPQVPPAATATVKQIISQLLPSTSSVCLIPCPLDQQEHHLLPATNGPPIVIYENEPSSIIAYALSSVDYHRKLYESRQPSSTEGPPPSPIELKRKSQQDVVSNDLMASVESTGSTRRNVLSFLRGGSPNMSANRAPSTPRHTAGEYDGVQYTANTSASVDEEQPVDNITSNTEAKCKPAFKVNPTFTSGSTEANIDVHFSDATTSFHCRVYLAEQFVSVRSLVCPEGEESYTRSLARCVQWAASGGKSGSAFCKTRDDRYVLKEMTQHEVQLFLEIAPNYLSYIRRALEGGQPTLLGKIVGVYRVGFRSTAGVSSSGNSTKKTNFLVMENLFYERSITQRFDLKGSVRNRLVEPTLLPQGEEIVLLDENLLKMTCDAPLYIQPHSKLVLSLAIEKDTQFLLSQAVMDYSLLVGFDEERKELVIGIIDYIRTFTWDKRVETILKSSRILGSQGKQPTVISPEMYQARFMAAMHRYFLPVPDRWTGLGRGVDC